MSDSRHHNNASLPLIAAISVGAVGGVLVGLLLARRPHAPEERGLTESVDDLRQRAEKILGELSQTAASDGAAQVSPFI